MSREDPDLMPTSVGLSSAFTLDRILALLCHATVMIFGYCPFGLGETPPRPVHPQPNILRTEKQ